MIENEIALENFEKGRLNGKDEGIRKSCDNLKELWIEKKVIKIWW